jgi:hypothetical protein
VTELDLRESLIPVHLIEHLAKMMPRDGTGEGYDYQSFLDVLVNGQLPQDVKRASSISSEQMISKRNSTIASSEQTRVNSTGGMARRSKHYL